MRTTTISSFAASRQEATEFIDRAYSTLGDRVINVSVCAYESNGEYFYVFITVRSDGTDNDEQ